MVRGYTQALEWTLTGVCLLWLVVRRLAAALCLSALERESQPSGDWSRPPPKVKWERRVDLGACQQNTKSPYFSYIHYIHPFHTHHLKTPRKKQLEHKIQNWAQRD